MKLLIEFAFWVARMWVCVVEESWNAFVTHKKLGTQRAGNCLIGLVNLVEEIQIFGISRDFNLIINACASVLFHLWYTNNIFMTETFFKPI